MNDAKSVGAPFVKPDEPESAEETEVPEDARPGLEAFKRDADGNIVAKKLDGKFISTHGGAPDDGFVVEKYELELQDGSTVNATKSLGRWDPVTKTIVPDARLDTDCHGVTFTDGEYWINDDEVAGVLAGGGFKKTGQASPGDIVVYRNSDGDVVHSVTVTQVDSDGKVTEVNGLGGLETQTHSDPPDEAWGDPNATQEVWTR